MIRYGYAPSGAADVDADYAFAQEDRRRVDAAGPRVLDRRGHLPGRRARPAHQHLGPGRRSAPVREGARRLDRPGCGRTRQLEERILGADGEYPVLRRAMDGLLEQYAHRARPGGEVRRRPVPVARPPRPAGRASTRCGRCRRRKQREALDFLAAARASRANAFGVSPTLLNRLGPDRWSHWGVDDNFGVSTGPRLDYNLNDKVLAIQTALLNALTAPALLARLREAESRSRRTRSACRELFDRLTRATWGEVGGASPAAIKALDGPQHAARRAAGLRRPAGDDGREPAARQPGRRAGAGAAAAPAHRHARAPRRWRARRRSATTRARTCSRRARGSSGRSRPAARRRRRGRARRSPRPEPRRCSRHAGGGAAAPASSFRGGRLRGPRRIGQNDPPLSDPAQQESIP